MARAKSLVPAFARMTVLVGKQESLLLTEQDQKRCVHLARFRRAIHGYWNAQTCRSFLQCHNHPWVARLKRAMTAGEMPIGEVQEKTDLPSRKNPNYRCVTPGMTEIRGSANQPATAPKVIVSERNGLFAVWHCHECAGPKARARRLFCLALMATSFLRRGVFLP